MLTPTQVTKYLTIIFLYAITFGVLGLVQHWLTDLLAIMLPFLLANTNEFDDVVYLV